VQQRRRQQLQLQLQLTAATATTATFLLGPWFLGSWFLALASWFWPSNLHPASAIRLICPRV